MDGGREEKKDGEKRATEPYHGATGMWDGRERYIKIGRMATLKEYRGRGVAAMLLEEALRWAGAHRGEVLEWGEREREEGKKDGEVGDKWKGLVLSHAQREVKGWWTKMGFIEDEGLGRWWEEGIEHVGMWRRLENHEK